MESNNINRISVTGLNSVEIDEFSKNKIIINNDELQYFQEYNIYILLFCYIFIYIMSLQNPYNNDKAYSTLGSIVDTPSLTGNAGLYVILFLDFGNILKSI